MTLTTEFTKFTRQSFGGGTKNRNVRGIEDK